MVPLHSYLARLIRGRLWPGSFAVAGLLLLFFAEGAASLPTETNSILTAWLNSQTNIQTWSADFTQTRRLKALVQPLTATGRVWFAAPNRFRWQINAPAETIALRQPDQVLVIYPRLKRIEKFPLSGEQPGPWKDALALLEAGFPRDRHQLESRFKIISITSSNGLAEVTLEPRSAPARRMMPEIKITFSTREFVLRATELGFADGSNMRNDFANQQINQPIEPALFNPPLEGDYKVVEPINK